MKYQLTQFKSRFDNKTEKRVSFKSWDDFEALLYKLSKMPMKSKKQAPLISPAVYTEGTTRANKNVEHWGGWAAVDVDEIKFEGDLEDELHSRCGSYYYVCYSTASSSIDHPKFRLVFPLSEHVDKDQIPHFWHALNEELGSIIDQQTKDRSRMYYIPATYAGAHNFIFTNSGDVIDIHDLMAKHPEPPRTGTSFIDRLPPELQKQVLEHRKNKLTNTDITWTSYRDCPFVSKKQVADYRSISATGWYAQMYKIMCTIACNAIKQKYPITAIEIEDLVRGLDLETGNWYGTRPINKEAENALEFAYKNVD